MVCTRERGSKQHCRWGIESPTVSLAAQARREAIVPVQLNQDIAMPMGDLPTLPSPADRLSPCPNRLVAGVAPDARVTPPDPQGGQDAADPTADHRDDGPEGLGQETGLEFAELRPASKEDLVDAGHAPSQTIGREQLTDRIADDRAQAVGRSGEDQRGVSQPEGARK